MKKASRKQIGRTFYFTTKTGPSANKLSSANLDDFSVREVFKVWAAPSMSMVKKARRTCKFAHMSQSKTIKEMAMRTLLRHFDRKTPNFGGLKGHLQ